MSFEEEFVQQRRVLVVDDEEPVRSLLMTVFESAGYVVDSAGGGREALAKLAPPAPDIMTLDLVMPDVTGWEVVEQLSTRPDPPAVILVSGSEGIDQRLPLPSYVGGVLNKPFLPRDLLDICENVLKDKEREKDKMARPQLVERRRVPRRDLIMDVRLAPSVGSPMLRGRLTDLSTLGAEVELPNSMSAGQTVRMALRFPGREHALLVDGQIQYCAMKSMLWACGLEFVNVSAKVQAELAVLLDLKSLSDIRDQ
jgi:CheY-like chemotaxis protein